MTALAVLPVVLLTLLIGARGVAAMRTTSDFLVASRRISPAFNAAAGRSDSSMYQTAPTSEQATMVNVTIAIRPNNVVRFAWPLPFSYPW